MNTLLLVYMKSLSLMSECERDSISWDEMKVIILLTPYIVSCSDIHCVCPPLTSFFSQHMSYFKESFKSFHLYTY